MFVGNIIELCHKNGDKTLFRGAISDEIHMRQVFSLEHIYVHTDREKKEIDILSPDDWEYMLKEKIITHDCGGRKGNLLTELSLAREHIPNDVLDVVYSDGLKNKRYRNLDNHMSLCRNLDVLSFLLEHGAVFKTKWHRPSSMEQWFVGTTEDRLVCFLKVLENYPQAIDKKYIKNIKNWFRLIHSVSVISDRYDRDGDYEDYKILDFWVNYLSSMNVISANTADNVVSDKRK